MTLYHVLFSPGQSEKEIKERIAELSKILTDKKAQLGYEQKNAEKINGTANKTANNKTTSSRSQFILKGKDSSGKTVLYVLRR